MDSRDFCHACEWPGLQYAREDDSVFYNYKITEYF